MTVAFLQQADRLVRRPVKADARQTHNRADRKGPPHAQGRRFGHRTIANRQHHAADARYMTEVLSLIPEQFERFIDFGCRHFDIQRRDYARLRRFLRAEAKRRSAG